ncbi:hypothetical protein [Borrelia miyamotoi]|uniref:hypothetical protein n=1 Tax=Borrelia miyamotoi TaxID=47466 RepID=UPI001C796D66|nr:hypothetical protein [Borrelia miyamotoi]BCR20728.1 hypothetical protein BmIO_00112 [Borrelia miyamotoi]
MCFKVMGLSYINYFLFILKILLKKLKFLAWIENIYRFREKYLGYRNTLDFYLLNILEHFLR